VLANKYRLEAPLGEGGQAAVWRATNLVLDAAVAVKLVKSDGTDQTEEQTVRLWDEARIIARLRHPGIVRVFDVDRTADGEPFVVMELLEGETLRELLDRQRRLDAREAVQLILPIADALAGANAQDVVHRDVKPENIFVCHSDDGFCSKLLDFGTVKLPTKEGQKRTTADCYLVGTPGYLAPEQILRDGDLDRRADVWGLCVTLYEMLTGRTPFDGATIEQVLRAAVTDEVTPVDKFVPCDPRLWRIIARGLAKQPSARWSSVGELGSALAQWLSDNGVRDDIAGVILERRWLGTNSEMTPAFGGGAVSSHAVVVPKALGKQRDRSWLIALSGVAVALGVGVWSLATRDSAEHARSRPWPASAGPAVVQPVMAAGPGVLATSAPRSAEPRRVDDLAEPGNAVEEPNSEAPAVRHPLPAHRTLPATTRPIASSTAASTSAAKYAAAKPRRSRVADLIDPY
jgi:serine/threonine-protein kinase